MWKIYLDTCCLNRPFDDETQDRIRLEAEAVGLILAHFQAGEWEWIASEVIDLEVDQTPDPVKRGHVQLLLQHVHRSVAVTQLEAKRMLEVEALGFRPLDALHLACAENGGAEVFLTTDDRLRRVASRVTTQLRVRVANPLTWLEEVIGE
jgi:predicted nucleic acid-binding protein